MALLIGGVQMGDQVKALNEGVDVLIATPGRLMDLFERGKIMLNGCELLVIDEADRMLDMGFIPDIEFICDKLPDQPPDAAVQRHHAAADREAGQEVPEQSQAHRSQPRRVHQRKHHRVQDPGEEPREAQTLEWLLRNDLVETAIVFSNRKTTVRELNKALQRNGFASGEIHGDIDQATRNARTCSVSRTARSIFSSPRTLPRGARHQGREPTSSITTRRGIPDDYVHRIGRTGRAGAKGRAFTFVAEDDDEAIDNVEKLTGAKIPVFGRKDVRVELPKAKAEQDKPKQDAAEADRTMPRKSARKNQNAPARARIMVLRPNRNASRAVRHEASPDPSTGKAIPPSASPAKAGNVRTSPSASRADSRAVTARKKSLCPPANGTGRSPNS